MHCLSSKNLSRHLKIDSDEPFAFVPALSCSLACLLYTKDLREPALHSFNLQVPMTRDNTMQIVRACQVAKPILLEGSPGVGKTSFIIALANLSSHCLCLLNLSDQMDLIDLFSSDFPVENGVTTTICANSCY
jgi:midasin